MGERLVLSASHCLDMITELGGKLTKIVFGDSLLEFLRPLAATLPTPEEQASAYHYAIPRLSTRLQRCNAQTIQAHLESAAATTPAAAAAAADARV